MTNSLYLPSMSYMQKVLMYISFFHHPVYYTTKSAVVGYNMEPVKAKKNKKTSSKLWHMQKQTPVLYVFKFKTLP